MDQNEINGMATYCVEWVFLRNSKATLLTHHSRDAAAVAATRKDDSMEETF
jgi:hypothetical protein